MLHELYLSDKFKAQLYAIKPDVINIRFKNLTTRTRKGKGKEGKGKELFYVILW